MTEMWTVKKTVVISMAHSLRLPYKSKCKEVHGHNWKVEVWCRASELNGEGMVVDFTRIATQVNTLDHRELYWEDVDGNPTSENIAKHIQKGLSDVGCYKVRVSETEGNSATYEVTA